ncbi:Interleukin-17C [Oryzias melastigma]|uniref:Interleukin-17C n=1 Tax=Oryzias melastigma TaxID=30732 RepID=A0A3B3DQ17_ORYME|nr:interleukin-17C [Oryzias melastigma]KAF6722084.1 Interleukin-17C [Oryzias melastigma]
MRVPQILIIVLWLAALCACKKCVRKEKLDEEATRTMARRGIGWHSISTPSSNTTGCPVDLYQNWVSTDDGKRSISPWKYREVTKEGFFPSTYMEAECLCTGCILVKGNTVKESMDYNSKHLVVSRLFLKRVLCKNKRNGTAEMYKLEIAQVDVAVGCFCARPNNKK